MQPAPEVGAVLERFAQGFGAKDIDAVMNIIADDEDLLFIGSDPDEWFRGRAGHKVIRAQFEEMAGVPATLENLTAYRNGDIGFASSRLTFTIPDGPTVAGRVTAVCELRGGEWKMVHGHFSIGVPNEEAIGIDLPMPE